MKAKNNKTIGINVRFFTNDLKVKEHLKEKLSCWDTGMIMIEANDVKGIKSANPTPFNSLEDIVPAIKQLCKKNKILIVSDGSKPRLK